MILLVNRPNLASSPFNWPIPSPIPRSQCLQIWNTDVATALTTTLCHPRSISKTLMATLTTLCRPLPALLDIPATLILPANMSHILPTSDFRVVRFTLGLVNIATSPVSINPQSVELCFHSDFEVSPLRPISLHFDRSHMTMYNEPLLLEAHPSPGVVAELGRVDILPDDRTLLPMLDEQIRREIREETAIQPARVAVTTSIPTSVLLVMRPLIGAVLLSALISYLSQTPSQTPSPISPVNTSFIDYPTNTSRVVAALCSVIFFNPLLNLAIGDGTNATADPDLHPGKVPTINES